jgi:hypothetical protein
MKTSALAASAALMKLFSGAEQLNNKNGKSSTSQTHEKLFIDSNMEHILNLVTTTVNNSEFMNYRFSGKLSRQPHSF